MDDERSASPETRPQVPAPIDPQADDRPDGGPSILQLTLVVALICALALGPITLVWQIDPTGPWQMMPVLALLVAIESVLTRRWLEWPGRRRGQPYYSLAELAILLALTPVFLWLASGRVPFPTSPDELLTNPLSIFDLELVLYMLLTVFVWERAHSWSKLFLGLSITTHEVKYYTSTSLERWTDRSIVLPLKDRRASLRNFVKSWITGGMLLVLCAALTTFDVRAASQSIAESGTLRTVTRLGLPSGILVALLIYFVGGLWLISLGRIAVLKGRWLADGSRRDLVLANKWHQWALIILLLAAFLASLLPIGDTVPLYRIVESIGNVVAMIVFGLMSLLTLVLYLFLRLLPQTSVPEDLPFDYGQAAAAQQSAEESDLAAMAIGSLFWVALVAIMVLATLYFLNERGFEFNVKSLKRYWQRFRDWLTGIWRGTGEITASLSTSLRMRLRRPSTRGAGLSRFGFLRVNALAPVEQVRFLYLALLRQADKKGLPRPSSATPNEFGRDLKERWPESGPDIDLLTESFLAARYSRQPIGQDRLASIKAAWFRIRKSLRRRPET